MSKNKNIAQDDKEIQEKKTPENTNTMDMDMLKPSSVSTKYDHVFDTFTVQFGGVNNINF